nr:response regulator [Acidobacteriota bacterium]
MSAPAEGPLILLVDDFDDAREMYRDYLAFAGFRVQTACDGREAVEKARALSPDLILMDLSLPVVDGWEATRILKADPATRHLLV